MRRTARRDIDESTDTYDTIDWLIKNVPNHNGRVGMWGISYPGFYTAAGMIDAHPALKAASPQAPVTDWFTGDDWHHNGAFFLPHAFDFLASFGHPRPAPTKVRHRPLPIWDARRLRLLSPPGAALPRQPALFQGRRAVLERDHAARHVRRVLAGPQPPPAPEGHQAGGHDRRRVVRRREPLRRARDLQEGGSQQPRRDECPGDGAVAARRLGRRQRGDALGPVSFHSDTAAYYREHIEFPFFQYHLKGKGSPTFPEAWVFETGSNQWRTFDVWPPREVKPRSLFLLPHAGLAFEPSGNGDAKPYDEYISDPSHPVEYIDKIEIGMTGDYMIQDQRVAARRPDVLVYSGGELKEDLTIAGPIQARLFVSTSGTDSDWVVKLIDVYPDDDPSSGLRPRRRRSSAATSNSSAAT